MHKGIQSIINYPNCQLNTQVIFVVDFLFNMDIDDSNYQQRTQDNRDAFTSSQRHERILTLLVIAIISLLTGNEILKRKIFQ
jgi:hypothetical protein